MTPSRGSISTRSIGAIPAAVLLAFATPLSAQNEASAADTAILLEALEVARNSPELAAEVNPVLKSMMVKGAAEPGWQRTGIDLRAAISALPGGTDANMIYEAAETGESISVLSGAELAAPGGFITYPLKDDVEGVPDERGYTSFGSGFWLETASWGRPEGNATCYSGKFNMKLHAAKPVIEWTLEEFSMVMMSYHLVVELSKFELCMVYSPAADGAYSWRAFSPDGRPFDQINSGTEVSRIIGADRLGAILAGSE